MNEEKALEIVNKILKSVLNIDSTYNLAEVKNLFAFDLRLPIEVADSTTGETTYTAMVNSKKFITNQNMEKRDEDEGWMQPYAKPSGLAEILEKWQKVNLTTTERVYNSENVIKSDPIYNSEFVYNSSDCNNCKNIIYCDGIHKSENCLACQRSGNLEHCIRVDDSSDCTNSYVVACSGKISNSMFIQDANTLHECIFCSHIANHEYCIANMQLEKPEYYALKNKILEWIVKELKNDL